MWKAINDATEVELVVNGVESGTLTTTSGQILMESSSSGGYVGINIESVGSQAEKSDGYVGFIYETLIANYLVDTNTLYSTTCTGYGG